MQIAQARKQQSEARLTLVRHQMQQAEVRAPQAGIVVEGELKKNLGSPLRKGDLLLKLAETANIDLELAIDQVDVHEVQAGLRGEVALVGRPEQHFALVVERVDPVATQREGHNVFLARARLEAEEQDWWRPGMGGNAKIDVGDRKLIWILTHRTVRFLREFFWL
jgi:multidrug efflux pump subunit AcrA (membrane-fusion protein)